jgi:hypothetical protein
MDGRANVWHCWNFPDIGKNPMKTCSDREFASKYDLRRFLGDVAEKVMEFS